MHVIIVLADTVNPYLVSQAALLFIKHGSSSAGLLKKDQVSDTVIPLANADFK